MSMVFKDPRPHWSVHDDIEPAPRSSRRLLTSTAVAPSVSSVSALPPPRSSYTRGFSRGPSASPSTYGYGSSSSSLSSHTYVPPSCLLDSKDAPPLYVARSAEIPLWHSVHKAGGPNMTAFDVNNRGNRVYFKFEPSAPTYFPVQETRFYKPELHKTDFLGTGQKLRSL